MMLLASSSTHENTPYLPDIKLSELVVATTEVSEAAEGASIVFIVVPTPFVRGIYSSIFLQAVLCGSG